MQAEVYFSEQPVGKISWLPDAYGVQVKLDCACPADGPALLRCYGETGGGPLLVGLPEPINGRLRLERHLSRETLKTAGCAQTPPKRFYLSDSPRQDRPPSPIRHSEEERPESIKNAAPSPIRTGDEVLDNLLSSGMVQIEIDGSELVLRCPFDPALPFALAPAFVLCTVEKGSAVLRWTKKDTANKAVSSSEG